MARSLHRPLTAGATPPGDVLLPEERVRRSTTTRRPAADTSARNDMLLPEERVRRSTTTRRAPDDSTRDDTPLPEERVRRSTTTRRAPDDARARAHSSDPHSNGKSRALTMPAFLSDAPPTPSSPAPAPSKLTKAPPPRASGDIPPMRVSADGFATPPQAHKHVASKSGGTLTRVFIGDMQRFNMVDIGPATSAKDVLALVEEQGSLKGWVGTGGWMVWEIAQDFGMERPIRSFELLADVQASWNKDKMVNTFVIKLTPFAPILSRSNIPSSSPAFSGYVEWEIKRGKWTKRYLRLREHSLWLSKRESTKDEVFLCSLSNFDAYTVTRLHKAPKPFVFAIKSTDNLSFFEDTADYMHIFACNPKDGDKWVEKILLARSYVLQQERNVLFNPKPAGGNAAGGLSRAATRKTSGSAPQRTVPQPLLTVAPLLSTPDRNDVFAPGSLLHQ
ncbi:hypothetical protein B0H17DRAFT_1067026 [Mycena rosella]|uniref:PH domain-containing protein n=1 Tax=Mycena rosella TaxID=1033263 RepID=A0AAD7DDI1_MYCRO|nr:hypothetical protein B0H17DRAFT_1067026 [Mycena rosella]